MDKQDEANSRLSFFLLTILKIGCKSKEGIENIPFLQAALVSGHNTYTHSPFADTPGLYPDSHEFNFRAEDQPF